MRVKNWGLNIQGLQPSRFYSQVYWHIYAALTKQKPINREAQACEKATIGEIHPEYAVTIEALADVLEAKGDYAEAEELRKQVSALHEHHGD